MYDEFAKHFDETRKAIWQSVGKFIDDIPSNSLVADVACGNGKYVRYRKDIVVIANDICKTFAELVGSGSSYDSILANGLYLPYRSNIFDYAISIAVVHHIRSFDHRVRFVQNIINSLKDGGTLLFTVWAAEQKIKKKWTEITQGSKDYDVPWLDKYSGNTYFRFYHLFDEQEVYLLCDNLKLIDTTKMNVCFEKENWVIKITKQEKIYP
jgi:tRNA (uracil-5-)-methyltransferase TRM9